MAFWTNNNHIKVLLKLFKINNKNLLDFIFTFSVYSLVSLCITFILTIVIILFKKTIVKLLFKCFSSITEVSYFNNS